MADLVSPSRTYGLVDILDRVLDKGLVVVGDIKINLANVELLTIQLRLVICSIDKAEAIGINWWRSDRFYSAAPNVAGSESANSTNMTTETTTTQTRTDPSKRVYTQEELRKSGETDPGSALEKTDPSVRMSGPR